MHLPNFKVYYIYTIIRGSNTYIEARVSNQSLYQIINYVYKIINIDN